MFNSSCPIKYSIFVCGKHWSIMGYKDTALFLVVLKLYILEVVSYILVFCKVTCITGLAAQTIFIKAFITHNNML